MAKGMALLWIAFGLVVVALIVYAMSTISPGTDWSWIAATVALYTIVLTVLGAAFFVLFSYLGRR